MVYLCIFLKYFNVNGSHVSYTPINDSVTLKISGDLNLAKGYDGKELPFYKRYFGGGSGSVRGFGNKTLGPLYPNGKAKGGGIMCWWASPVIESNTIYGNSAWQYDINDSISIAGGIYLAGDSNPEIIKNIIFTLFIK